MSKCHSCEVLTINGHRCHEAGCPEAWRDETRECKECGTKFTPGDPMQRYCAEECYCSYMGLPYSGDTEEQDDE